MDKLDKIDVHDGYVKLLEVMGSDLSVINAAKASFAKESKELDEKGEKLIKFLIKNGHTSPLRHQFLSFEIKAPLMVCRQWWKYRVASTHTDEDESDGWNESCFSGDTVIASWNRSRTATIKEIHENPESNTFNIPSVIDNNNKLVVKPNIIKKIWKSENTKELFRVTVGDHYVDITGDHRILTDNYLHDVILHKPFYVMLQDLKVGDKVAYLNPDNYQIEFWPIISIQSLGEQYVYDVEMQHEPNLIVNHIVVHNSRRYVTSEPEFYVPKIWRSQPENKKQGSGADLQDEINKELSNRLESYINAGSELYLYAIEHNVAVEQARLFLPAYGMYVNWRWSASLQAVLHFLKQRLEDDAQKEIREFAKAVYDLAAPHFPVTFREYLEV